MRVFIAGARAIKTLDTPAKMKLEDIFSKHYDILIGDCYGIDSEVQKYCVSKHYNNVTVFASNGKARNNFGGWRIENVSVDSSIKGFEFYRKKDIAMAQAATCGFMIWDEKSKGTYQNIITMLEMNKRVLVYFAPEKTMIWLKALSDLRVPVSHKETMMSSEQLSLF